MKKCMIFVGANGSGKTTLASQIGVYQSHMNPDDWGLEHFGLNRNTQEVAIATTKIIEGWLDAGVDFSFETVASSEQKIDLIARIALADYFVTVHYCQLANDKDSIDGVTRRVRNGGHDVPIEKLIHRYPKVLHNIKKIKDLANEFNVWQYGRELS